jgi:hypothetical protein
VRTEAGSPAESRVEAVAAESTRTRRGGDGGRGDPQRRGEKTSEVRSGALRRLGEETPGPKGRGGAAPGKSQGSGGAPPLDGLPNAREMQPVEEFRVGLQPGENIGIPPGFGVSKLSLRASLAARG